MPRSLPQDGANERDLGFLLDAAEALPPDGAVEAFATELAGWAGAAEVSLLVPDITGTTLTRLAVVPPPGGSPPLREARGQVPIEQTPAGAALVAQRIQVSSDDDGVWIHVPVTERGEAVGVLELRLDGPPDARLRDDLRAAGRVLAYVVVADRRFSDLYELGQRSTPLSLEAEVQRRLLPASYACEGPQFALAGWMIPADSAGGDTFDYSVDRDTLHLSITDAMGHGVPAAMLATLAVGACATAASAATGSPSRPSWPAQRSRRTPHRTSSSRRCWRASTSRPGSCRSSTPGT